MTRSDAPGTALPWYARATYIMCGTVLLLAFLYVAKDLLVPLIYAGLLAILVHPVSEFLDKRKIPRMISSFIAVAAACIVLAGVAALIAMQIGQFGDELPRIREQGQQFLNRLQLFITQTFGVTYSDQLRWFHQWWDQSWKQGGEAISQTLLTFKDILSLVILVPLYAFLMLVYQDHLVAFLFQMSDRENNATLRDVLEETRTVVKGYVVGLMIETSVVAVLNSVALLLLGIPYAILFGVLAAILNLIPYIGGFIGIALPMLMAVISKDSAWYPAGVVLAFVMIQLVDNHILVPYIVASRISINALISVIAVLIGGMLWGISGMFLSLPMVAILKIIFDRVEGLKPWGHLLGHETRPTPAKTSAALR